jgi:PAS domain S-box-containing protein
MSLGSQANDRVLDGSTLIFFRWRNEEGWPVEYVTSTVEGLLGYSAEAFKSGQIIYANLIHPDDLPTVIAEVQSNSDSAVERFEHVPYRVRHANGAYIWVNDTTAILRNAQGKATHYFGHISYRSSDTLR